MQITVVSCRVTVERVSNTTLSSLSLLDDTLAPSLRSGLKCRRNRKSSLLDILDMLDILGSPGLIGLFSAQACLSISMPEVIVFQTQTEYDVLP